MLCVHIQKLIQAHRTLILEDVIVIKNQDQAKKKSILGKDQVKLQIWLFNDVLVHLKTSKSKTKTNVASAKYTWPLQLVWLKDEKEDSGEPKLPHSFTLVGPLKNYNLRFPDFSAKQKWFTAIKDAVQKVLTPEIAPGTSLTNDPCYLLLTHSLTHSLTYIYSLSLSLSCARSLNRRTNKIRCLRVPE